MSITSIMVLTGLCLAYLPRYIFIAPLSCDIWHLFKASFTERRRIGKKVLFSIRCVRIILQSLGTFSNQSQKNPSRSESSSASCAGAAPTSERQAMIGSERKGSGWSSRQVALESNHYPFNQSQSELVAPTPMQPLRKNQTNLLYA